MDVTTENEYEIIGTLHDSDNSRIFRAKHNASGHEVILKQSKGPVRAGLYNEYNLIREQATDNSMILLTRQEQIPALVRKFYPGKSLREELASNKGVKFFFSTCFRIVDELQKIHAREIIHKDLTPDNILIDHTNNSVHIIDFELSTKQQFQPAMFNGVSVIEGTLQYMSPEQTGRMNRVIDYRSDFYSLGVIFYEMLTGTKPFEGKDALELIHCHIARTAPSITAVAPEVPEGLAMVVNKLIAKNAEERYQSLSGLYVDLEHCSKELKEKGTIAPFELAKADLPLRLSVSQRLIGRETEIENIFSLFEKAAEGKRVILELKGASGLGKTMLIRETARPLTATKGTYISGKFDLIQRTVPYFAWRQAFDQLADLLLTESEENISSYRNLLTEQMQGLESDIIAIAPKWKLLFTRAQPLPVLNPKEQQGRVLFAVSLFLKSIMQITQPLLIFLDDWQWADDASIELLKNVAADGTLGKLFLALAYRPNETGSTHVFTRALSEIRSKQKNGSAGAELLLGTIELNPLSSADANEILADTFSCNRSVSRDLADLIYSKTLGNPFFINQLLDYLYSKKHIWLDEKQIKWTWDLPAISKLAVTDDIATVIIEKISDISPTTTDALMYASCLGNIFSLASLHYITGTPKPELHATLWEAIKENIIEPLEKDYKFVPEFYEENGTNIRFRFTHDRIQQALYNRAEPKLREQLNFNAAEYEMANPGEVENVFITANHLLASGKLVENSRNKSTAAAILLEAGQKAFASAAYNSSFIFLRLFEEIAAAGAISISDYSLLIQASYLNDEDEKADEYRGKAFLVARGKMERSLIYEAVLKGTIAMNKLNDAVAIARKAFAELGFKIPPGKATKGQIILSAIKTQIAFPDKKIAAIGASPDMKDETGVALMRMMYNSLAAFFFVERDTYPLIIFKMVRLSKKLGNTPESIIGYGSYGLILAGVLNKPEAGYHAGKEAMKLFDRFDAPHLVSSAGFVDTTFISHWKEPLASFENDCLKYYEKGLNTGNLEYAAWNLYSHSNSVFFRGSRINEIVDLYTEYEKFYLNHKQMNAYGASLIIKSTLSRMMAAEPVDIRDSKEERDLFALESKANNTAFLFVYHTMKLFLGVLHDQCSLVLESAFQNEKDIENAASLYWQPYFRALKAAAYINCVFEGKLDYAKAKKAIAADRKKLKIANSLFDGNTGWIIDLIDAETEAWEKKNVNHSLYDRAYKKAINGKFFFPTVIIELMRIRKMKYLNIAGSRPYWMEVKEKLSSLAMSSVIHAWEAKFTEFRIGKDIDAELSLNKGRMTSESIDVQTIIKTTQTLSSEIVLTRLVDKMMAFAMENAGARYGCFIIKKEDRYAIVSEKFAHGLSRDTDTHDGIPESIFNYVQRTREPLILDNALETPPYSKDPKIVGLAERSVLCIPIIFQNECIGMIYLTNQLSKAVFTEQRIGLLKMLAGQMGASLQNAILYENLEKLVETRTQQVVEQKNLIEEKAAELAGRHKEITDSINYAERIQRALLASRKVLDENLQEHFVLYKPKDVVSGDFYWATKLLNGNFLLATADSTGHGVAGAIMSIVNIACIKEAVSKDLLSPDLLMNEIRRLVIESLKNDGSAEGGKDGMDASLVAFDFKNNILRCACAINPVWIIRENELVEVKADRFPIGKHDLNTTPFSLQTVDLKKDDLVYTMTDGFADQFGGPKGKKFMYKQLKNLLLSVAHEPMEIQRQRLDEVFTEWKGEMEQIDDVCIIGVRI
ncbi:MAG: trifunctional serine/threonine-protein kinase/ATP-binding protein/SpoIIE family protein phosphatase [Bacteroidia bacterium]